MQSIRNYLPDYVNNNIMYYYGTALCFFQYYINNTFSASEITDKLFVGDLASALNNNAMKEQGITHILSVFNGSYEIFSGEFKYKIIHINDDPWVDIGKYFDESNVFIENALKDPSAKVMIHCHKGVSRSVTFLLAYMLFKRNESQQIPQNATYKTIKDILDDVKRHRAIAEPNEGFIESLKLYIHRLNRYNNININNPNIIG